MRVAEILKHVIDLLDQEEQQQSQDTISSETPVMVPPLQQKIELLKKSSGLDNVYDEQPEDETNEIENLKKRAGLSNIQITTLSDDEPFEG